MLTPELSTKMQQSGKNLSNTHWIRSNSSHRYTLIRIHWFIRTFAFDGMQVHVARTAI